MGEQLEYIERERRWGREQPQHDDGAEFDALDQSWKRRYATLKAHRGELLAACELGDPLQMMDGPTLLRYVVEILRDVSEIDVSVRLRNRLLEKADAEEAAIAKAKDDN